MFSLWIRDYFVQKDIDAAETLAEFLGIKHYTVNIKDAVDGITRNIPSEKLIEKTPADGLTGKSDEENLGFSYEELDRYIRTGIIDNPNTKARIDELHRINQFKLLPMPAFNPNSEALT